MRIFIHNCDSYIGKALAKELRKAATGLNRIFGTASKASEAPKAVKRVVSRDDPKKAKKMAETMQSCRLVIMNLFDCTLEDLHFAIEALKVDPKASPPKSTGQLESDVIFILISSAMVWSETQPETPGATIKDSDYLRREPKPDSSYVAWKEMEDLVFSCFNREESQVKGFVVAGGALYGDGESTLADMFKDAWRGVKSLSVMPPGNNLVPTIHVRDMARLVRQISINADAGSLNPLESTPYFLAVDQPPAKEGETPKPPTQASIVQGIVDNAGEHYDVPMNRAQRVDEDSLTPEQLAMRERLSLNLWIEPSAIMLSEEYSAECDPPGWVCKDGFVANLRTITDEFCAGKKLRAMRIIVAGPPASGKTALAKAIAEHLNVPHLQIGASPSGEDLKDMTDQISSNVCRYRGYVLDAGGIGFAEAEKLFRFDVELPKPEEEEAAEEGAEATPPKFERRLNEETCPSFAIVTQAPKGICKAKWQGADQAEFARRYDAYVESNLTTDVHSLADFFQDVANKGVLNLPIAGKDEEDLFESARIFVESAGRPFNYLPTEEEVHKEIRERLAAKYDKEKEAAVAASSKKDNRDAELKEEERQHAARMKTILQHEAAQAKLMKMPLREYLMQFMVPSLTEGLIEVCKVLPDNPVDYLANYLEDHAADAPPGKH